MTEVLAFNTWSMSGIKIEDAGLQKYITIDSKFVPKTGARYAGRRFHKSKTFIVERLINKIMIPGHKSKKHFRSSGHNTGKSAKSYKIVFDAFKIIEDRSKENPLKVFIKAIENASPREEIVAIEYGGARYPKAVDCSPQRRIDVALRYFVQGAYDNSFNKKKSVEDALAEEILSAYRLDGKSLAVSKKSELERQAEASR